MLRIRYLTKFAINCAKYNHSLVNQSNKTINSQPIIANYLTNRFLCSKTLSEIANNEYEEEDNDPSKKGMKRSQKRHPSRDRREVISVETSLRYMNSKAYENSYHRYSVWHLHRRKFNKQWAPLVPRENCVKEDGFLMSGNPCPICRDKYLILHYTNLELLKQFINPYTGYLYPNTYVCLCFKQYENLCVAYTLAKEYGLVSFEMPFREYDYSLYYPNHNQNEIIKS